MRPRVEVLVTRDCPNAGVARERTAAVAGRIVPGVEPRTVLVRSREEALELAFPGSPTIRVEDEDVELDPPTTPAIACRSYDGSGVPPEWLIEAAVLRSLEPRHVLFLCVANSARSQLAEGLAREVAPDAVRISSAGSDPGTIREEAAEVLGELGIDARGQRSKGVDEVEGPVDAVITLCAEEVCPAWLGDAPRLHWPFPDPAAVDEGTGERLEAFRRVRDELARRVRHLFPGRRD